MTVRPRVLSKERVRGATLVLVTLAVAASRAWREESQVRGNNTTALVKQNNHLQPLRFPLSAYGRVHWWSGGWWGYVRSERASVWSPGCVLRLSPSSAKAIARSELQLEKASHDTTNNNKNLSQTRPSVPVTSYACFCTFIDSFTSCFLTYKSHLYKQSAAQIKAVPGFLPLRRVSCPLIFTVYTPFPILTFTKIKIENRRTAIAAPSALPPSPLPSLRFPQVLLPPPGWADTATAAAPAAAAAADSTSLLTAAALAVLTTMAAAVSL